MSDQIVQDQEKVDEYLRVIQERILAPIQNTGIQSYCTATLLLLFAAIDGLGQLLHPSEKVKVSSGIEITLEYMGEDYNACKEELLNLRNILVHNAINVASYLSKTDIAVDQHLWKKGRAGFIYVNTTVMYNDFVKAFNRFCTEIHHNPELMKRAADRLESSEVDALDKLDFPDGVTPSLPPPVQFISTKEKKATQ